MNYPHQFGRYIYDRDLHVSNPYVSLIVARDSLKGNEVAVKIFARNNPDFDLIEQEIRIQESLSHPHIVSINDIVYHEDVIFVVMKYYANGDLIDVMENARMPLKRKITMFKQIIDAVSYMHKRGIAHLDIKPENIFIDENMDAALADFGCCESSLNRKRPFFQRGTLIYSAPEIFDNSIIDHRPSDIWSLGILLYALSTNQLPWRQGSNEELVEQIKKGQLLAIDVIPQNLQKIILACCQRDPRRRIIADQLTHYFADVDRNNSSAAVKRAISLKSPNHPRSIQISMPEQLLRKSVNRIRAHASIVKKGQAMSNMASITTLPKI